MRSRSAAKSTALALSVSFLLFLLTRAVTWTAFPIFNDESLYLQYAQSMHDDWQKNKFISMDGHYHDWKPPLQYWITAPFIGIGGDPLRAGRAVALVVSAAGLFGFYLWTRELFGHGEGLIATMLYSLCPPVLFHNDQFTAETFLFATAPFLYWSVLKLLAPGRLRFVWFAIAVMLGAALLLLKQSGFLLLLVSVALPLTRLIRTGSNGAATAHPNLSTPIVRYADWRYLVVNCGLTVAVILMSQVIEKLVIPSEFNETKERFNSHWVMSPAELLHLPSDSWRANLTVVAEYIGAYYGWGVVVFCCVFGWIAFRRRSLPDVALIAMCAAGAVGVCFMLRGFNEYMFNTAVVSALLPLLSRTLVVVWNFGRAGLEGFMRNALLAVAGVTVVFWTYQITLMAVSPGRYIERSTRWAIANYLKGWSTGFGVDEVITSLGKIHGPFVVFTDTQWGNPRTPIELYQKYHYAEAKIFPITREFLNAEETRKLRDYSRTLAPVHLAIFSLDSSGRRQQWQANITNNMCEQRSQISSYSGQTPIVVCRF